MLINLKAMKKLNSRAMNKSFYFILILIIGFVTSTFGQNTLELTFTAQNNGQYVPLDSIYVENLAQGGDTTLYAPDTVLVLDYVTSIGNNETIEGNSFFVSQNYPNPFKGKTEVNVYLPEFEFDGWTPCSGISVVSDIDGNVYNTALIGDQCWMKENLKTTTYRNGTSIPNVTDANAWSNLTSGAYVWYDNDISWKGIYGALYNWYATVDTNGLCPTGWHVPTNDEWTALTNYIGGTGSPHGNELKSCRQVNSPQGEGCNTTEHPRWNEDSNKWGTDDYGFSGLPGGSRYNYGTYDFIGEIGSWWSSTEDSSGIAWGRFLDYTYGIVFVGPVYERTGMSVRCVQDN